MPKQELASTKPIAAESIERLDNIISNALAIQNTDGQGMGAAFQMADAMNNLMESITPDMVDRFMKLQNTGLGFRTDCDPSKPHWKTGAIPVAYTADVVKRCVVEAVLLGVLPVGNMFNIIAGNTYLTKEGYIFKLKRLEGFTQFEPTYGTPQIAGDGKEAIVRCAGKWHYKGQEQSIGLDEKQPCKIVVKINSMMGSDGAIGKAQRKFLKRVYEQVTGCQTPDGEVGDDPLTLAAPKTAELPAGPAGAATDAKAELITGTVADTIKGLLKRDGVTDDQVLAYLKTVKMAGADIKDLYQLSDEVLTKVIGAWAAVVKNAKEVKA